MLCAPSKLCNQIGQDQQYDKYQGDYHTDPETGLIFTGQRRSRMGIAYGRLKRSGSLTARTNRAVINGLASRAGIRHRLDHLSSVRQIGIYIKGILINNFICFCTIVKGFLL